MRNMTNSMCIVLWTFLLFCTGDRVKLLFTCPVLCSCFTERGSLFTSVRCKLDAGDSENYSSFPVVLPADTSIVELQVVGNVLFNRTPFNDSSWHRVLELIINAREDFSELSVSNDFLHGLDNLKVLRMHHFVRFLESGAFLNTPDIETLDLSDSPSLRIENLNTALRYAMPNLKYLDISRIQRIKDEPIVLGTEFTESIRTKPLEVLNVSETKLAMLDTSFNYSSVQVLNISQNSLHWIPRKISHEWFANVRELDISYSTLPAFVDRFITPSIIFNISMKCNIFMRSLRYLYAHDINSRVPLRIMDVFMNLSCEPMIEFIDISNLNVRWLNCSTNVVFFYLKTVIVSRNSLEYISPKCLRSFPNMSELRLERNNLGNMQYYPDFEEVFSNNEALEILDMSWNSISFLPKKLFVSLTNLKKLNLQGNKIVHFDVEIRDLYNLRVLDLSQNGLTLISSNVMHDLDTINSRMLEVTMWSNISSINYSYCLTATYTDTTCLVINLQGNKFDCSCEHVSFLTWMTESKIHFEGKSGYKCGLGFSIQEPVNGSIHDLINYCNLKKHLPFIIVSSIIGGLVILSVVLIGILIRRRAKLGKKRRKYVNRYQKSENEEDNFIDKRYPAFLSFCALDEDVVKQYFYDKFSNALEAYFGEKDLLAFGEKIMIPGKSINTEIERCFSRSAVILFLVTTDFIESKWCKVEMKEAYFQGKPTICLVENTVLKRRMPSWLRKLQNSRTRASWRREGNDITITPDWDVLTRQVVDLAVEAEPEEGLQELVHLPLLLCQSSVGILVILSVVLIGLYILRRVKFGKRRRKNVHGYEKRENEEDNLKVKIYLGFESFCSEDNDVAKNFFYQKFTLALRKHL